MRYAVQHAEECPIAVLAHEAEPAGPVPEKEGMPDAPAPQPLSEDLRERP
jgi:hypothetical protein